MIREKQKLQPYPSKTVLEDLATRSGPANSESFTPFTGKAGVLRDQFSGSQMDNFDLDGFLNENRQFDLNPSKLRIQKTVGMMEIAEYDTSRKTLEDFIVDGIEHDAIKNWFISACIGYKKHQNSPYRERVYTYSTNLSYGDDDDSVLDIRLTENVKTNYSVDQEEYEMALRKLPFYIKAIWSYSIIYKANLFSFIKGYIKLLRLKGQLAIRSKDFVDVETYALNGYGKYIRHFNHLEDMKTEKYSRVVDLFVRPHIHVVEANLIKSFINVCQMLDIDFEKQDTMIFTNEFVDRIICTYLPTTTEYFKYYGEVDAEVMYAIKSDNLYSKTKATIYTDPNNTLDANTENSYFADLESRLQILYRTSSMAPNPDADKLFFGDEELAKKNINEYFSCMQDKPVDVSQFLDFSKGFLVHYNGKPLTIEKDHMLSQYNGETGFKLLFTTNGSIIIYTLDAELLIALPAEKVIDALEEYYNDERRKNYWINL